MHTVRNTMTLLHPTANARYNGRHLFGTVLLILLLLAGCDSAQVDAPDLTAPLLQTPQDGQAIGVGKTVTFSWQPVAGARRYECEVRIAEDERQSVATVLTNRLTTTLAFDAPGQYAWRVRAINADDDVGYWSEPFELTIQSRTDP